VPKSADQLSHKPLVNFGIFRVLKLRLIGAKSNKNAEYSRDILGRKFLVLHNLRDLGNEYFVKFLIHGRLKDIADFGEDFEEAKHVRIFKALTSLAL
jgi:hypothetical protein